MDFIIFILRVILPILSIFIVLRCFLSMKKNQRGNRTLIVLKNIITGEEIPIKYWENSIGRDKNCDVIINEATVSREHAVLFRRKKGWLISDTGSKSGININGEKVVGQAPVYIGDNISMGSCSFKLIKASESEVVKNPIERMTLKPIRSKSLLFLVLIFHGLITLEALFSKGLTGFDNILDFLDFLFPMGALFCISFIFYFFSSVIFKRVTFELETLGIFLSGIGILTIGNYDIKEVYIQVISLVIGIFLYCFLIWFIEKVDLVMKFRLYIAIFAVLLFAVNLLLAKEVNGSRNWVRLGGFTFQPSELIKIAYIFVGASTLEELQTTKNLTGFIVFSAICIGSLFLMKDFGTACVFFIAFLIISFMRSGRLRTVILSCSAALLGAFMILTFKPYIKDRFAVWGHVWEHTQDSGYQQTRVLSYAASGGLIGVGSGQGKLNSVFAALNDLMFGVICEELGLIIALVIALTIAGMAFFVKGQSNKSRSTFYSIASCSAAAMLVFQCGLHIFGSTDILPMTGVTLPFVSLGGSSLVSVWGLLAFIKASDERTYSLRR